MSSLTGPCEAGLRCSVRERRPRVISDLRIRKKNSRKGTQFHPATRGEGFEWLRYWIPERFMVRTGKFGSPIVTRWSYRNLKRLLPFLLEGYGLKPRTPGYPVAEPKPVKIGHATPKRRMPAMAVAEHKEHRDSYIGRFKG